MRRANFEGPHRPVVVNLLRRSSASLRSFRDDNAGPMRPLAAMAFVDKSRLLKSALRSKALNSPKPEPRGAVKARERSERPRSGLARTNASHSPRLDGEHGSGPAELCASRRDAPAKRPGGEGDSQPTFAPRYAARRAPKHERLLSFYDGAENNRLAAKIALVNRSDSHNYSVAQIARACGRVSVGGDPDKRPVNRHNQDRQPEANRRTPPNGGRDLKQRRTGLFWSLLALQRLNNRRGLSILPGVRKGLNPLQTMAVKPNGRRLASRWNIATAQHLIGRSTHGGA